MNIVTALAAYRSAFWAVIVALAGGSITLFFAGSLKIQAEHIALERRDLAIVQKVCKVNDKQLVFDAQRIRVMQSIDRQYAPFFTDKQLAWMLARDRAYSQWIGQIASLRKEKCEADALVLIRSVL